MTDQTWILPYAAIIITLCVMCYMFTGVNSKLDSMRIEIRQNIGKSPEQFQNVGNLEKDELNSKELENLLYMVQSAQIDSYDKNKITHVVELYLDIAKSSVYKRIGKAAYDEKFKEKK